MSTGEPPLIAIVGATASGKTALAVALARRLDAEIVNADSRQVYRGMAVGTAQPSPLELAAAPHHLVGFLPPDAPFGLAQYLDLARDAITEIRARGRTPLLVGGSGQYVRALTDGWQVPRVPANPAFRAALEAEAKTAGVDALHARLAAVDPESARSIHPNNVRRVIRAIEVSRFSDRPISARRLAAHPTLLIGLAVHRIALHARIDRRVEAMFHDGFIQEVERLRAEGYTRRLPSMQSIGYPEVWAMLEGEFDLMEAIRRVQLGTHRLARLQHTWFGRDDRIRWLDPEDPHHLAEAAALIEHER